MAERSEPSDLSGNIDSHPEALLVLLVSSAVYAEGQLTSFAAVVPIGSLAMMLSPSASH